MKTHLLLLIFFCFPWLHLSAQEEPKVSAQLNSNRLYVGDSATLKLTVENTEEEVQVLENQFENFSLEIGSSNFFSNTTIINGKMTKKSGQTLQLTLTAQQPGTYSWPGIKVNLGGKIFQSNPISLRVKEIQKQSNVILLLEAEDREVFIQQEITVRLRILLKTFNSPFESVEPLITNNEPQLSIPWLEDQESFKSTQNLQNDLSKMLSSNSGFQINNYSRQKGIFLRSEAAIFALPHQIIKYPQNGDMTYHQYTLERKWQPLKTGEFTFNPATFKGMFPLKVRKEGSNLLIENQENIRALSNSLNLIVRDVPLKNRPENYTGAIGNFSVQTSIDRQNVQVGEPILMNINIKGTGLLEPIGMPDLKSSPEFANNFKIYIDNLDGTLDGNQKIFQATLRPLNDNITQIPAVSLSYFDIKSKSFSQAQSSPIPIQVTSTKQVAINDVISNISEEPLMDIFKQRQRGLVESMTASQIMASSQSQIVPLLNFLKWFNGFLGSLVLILWTYKKWIYPQSKNTAQKLAKTAVTRARQAVNELVSGEEQVGQLGQILLTCLAQRFGKPTSGYSRDDASKDLETSSISQNIQEKIIQFLDLADQSRFGGGQAISDDDFEKQIRSIFDELEKLK